MLPHSFICLVQFGLVGPLAAFADLYCLALCTQAPQTGATAAAHTHTAQTGAAAAARAHTQTHTRTAHTGATAAAHMHPT
eukprot:scaffold8449_cov18-Tisochrysis_lutea.AAC.2